MPINPYTNVSTSVEVPASSATPQAGATLAPQAGTVLATPNAPSRAAYDADSCTLDDLVPNTKCTRVTLEPLEDVKYTPVLVYTGAALGMEMKPTSYENLESMYRVVFDICIYDKLEGNKDIINFCPGIGKGKIISASKIQKLIDIDCENDNEIIKKVKA